MKVVKDLLQIGFLKFLCEFIYEFSLENFVPDNYDAMRGNNNSTTGNGCLHQVDLLIENRIG